MTTVKDAQDVIDAFKEDMKKLGVYVYVSISPTPISVPYEFALKMKTLATEFLEAEETKRKESKYIARFARKVAEG